MECRHDSTYFFKEGKLGVLLSSPAGSTGKGKLGAWLLKNNYGPKPFVCNTFSSQASHTVVQGGKEHVYKHLNSCAHMPDSYSKMYIGQGAAITTSVLLAEIEKYGMTPDKLGIHPLCTIIQEVDQKYEMGECGFDGEASSGAMIKSGSTCSGVGTALARKIMRRPNMKLAKDVEEFKPFLCQVELEIMERLDGGECGLLEIAQGFQLSNGLYDMFPYVSSRNSTAIGGFNDMMVPAFYMGNVFLDERAFPIRIHSYKYILEEDVRVDFANTTDLGGTLTSMESKYHPEHFDIVYYAHDKEVDATNLASVAKLRSDAGNPISGVISVWRRKGAHLYWQEVNDPKFDGKFDVIESFSGPGWPDQLETTWEKVAKDAGVPEDMDITSYTTLTKLPRRVYDFSMEGLRKAIKYNTPPNGCDVYVSLNFINYVDWNMNGKVGHGITDDEFDTSVVTEKCINFIEEKGFDQVYLLGILADVHAGGRLALLGTGADTDEYVSLV
jgi:adenylosuccinate synthase